MIQLPFIFFRNNMDSPIFRFRRRVLAEKNPAVFAQDIEDSLDEFFTNRLTLRLMISHIQALNANTNVNSDGEAPPPKNLYSRDCRTGTSLSLFNHLMGIMMCFYLKVR